jgi:hypothetical protein
MPAAGAGGWAWNAQSLLQNVGFSMQVKWQVVRAIPSRLTVHSSVVCSAGRAQDSA